MSPPDRDVPDPSSHDHLDVLVLEDLRGIMADDQLVGDIIRAFLADTPSRLRVMQDALESGDLPGVASQMHAVKGAAGSLGASRLAWLCAQQADSGRVEEIGSEFANVAQALTDYLARLD